MAVDDFAAVHFALEGMQRACIALPTHTPARSRSCRPYCTAAEVHCITFRAVSAFVNLNATPPLQDPIDANLEFNKEVAKLAAAGKGVIFACEVRTLLSQHCGLDAQLVVGQH